MGDLGAIHEDVPFAWAAAERLATELRGSARVCEGQIPHRNAIAEQAQEEWRGAYAGKFSERMETCTGDAGRLADAMRRAADILDELIQLAREEQTRREQARAWELEHDAWEREQEDRSIAEKVGDFFGGDDEPKPPPGPRSEPVLTAEPHIPASRE